MKRNIFLTFDSNDMNLVNLFRGQAKNKNSDLDFSDYSVKDPFDSTRAEYIKQQIRALLEKVSVTICLIGYETHKSRWVDWELRESARLGKGLVGVRLHSSWQDLTPKALSDNQLQPIDWDIDKVVRAIEASAVKR